MCLYLRNSIYFKMLNEGLKMKKEKLKPLLKYPGGKTSELGVINENLPSNINNYIEPFVGGGAVYFDLDNKNNFINDKSEELILLYKYIKDNNPTFYNELDIIISNWNKLKELANNDRIINLYIKYRNDDKFDMHQELRDIINIGIEKTPMFTLRKSIKFESFLVDCLYQKFSLIKRNEIKKKELLEHSPLIDNIEAGIKAAYYTYLRDVYNKPGEYNKLSKPRKVAIYLFIREYCYSSMFRFNKNGGFNVPYGGVSYNKKTLETKITYYKTKEVKNILNHTQFYNEDFYSFLNKIKIDKNDFMFLDPPYDTTFSEYDRNSFGMEDQKRLANYLINECPCRFMLIIKKTDFIESLYINQGLKILEQDKTYFVSFKNRNKKDVKHLIIMNY